MKRLRLSIQGAPLLLAEESPPHGTRSPGSLGFTTGRIELFVDDPVAVQRQALAAGATAHSSVEEPARTRSLACCSGRTPGY
ncbi:MAG TPA: hypothetical protein VF740_05875 [Candidatus Acidoferrum sp.]